MNNKEIFEKMLNTNVKGFIEKKNNLNYLSWCQAWEQFKLNYPDAKYRIIRFENNLPYIYDKETGYMVFTEVTVNDLTYEMWLPVMDSNNQAMKAEPYKYDGGRNMKPRFSLKYGDEFVTSETLESKETKDGFVFELEK